MADTVIVPWYATGFRADSFEQALNETAAIALRYGASSYAVYRSKDDRYRFQQVAHFANHLDWERYWDGPEMTDFRVRHSSWYQVPVLYGWWDRTAAGSIEGEPVFSEAPNGHSGDQGGPNGHSGNGGSGAGEPTNGHSSDSPTPHYV
jgi:hypothetical protein